MKREFLTRMNWYANVSRLAKHLCAADWNERILLNGQPPLSEHREKYYRVMLGKGSIHAEKCVAGNFIGADFDINQDLTGRLPEDWRPFNKEFTPIFLAGHPDKTKIGAGLACGMLWTISKAF